MASELRVNTLKDAAGNNSVGTEYVANGSAKMTCRFNGSGTVTIASGSSLNASSIDDDGVGEYSINHTSNFAQADNTVVVGSSGYHENFGTVSSASDTHIDAQNNSHAQSDPGQAATAVFGDLA